MASNKHQAVRQWLESGASISSMEAFKQLGVTRLSAIIFDLKAKGMDIDAVWGEQTDRFGNKARFKRYFLKK